MQDHPVTYNKQRHSIYRISPFLESKESEREREFERGGGGLLPVRFHGLKTLRGLLGSRTLASGYPTSSWQIVVETTPRSRAKLIPDLANRSTKPTRGREEVALLSPRSLQYCVVAYT